MDFESKVEYLYQRLLRPGDVCIDVGANEGRHLFPMAKRVSPGGHVYAFEPIPSLNAALGAEIARQGLAGIVDLYYYAASNEDGESEFVVALDAPGYSGLKERHYDLATRLERIQVPTRKLDTVLPDLVALRFLKVDVEGGEWGVISGAARLIERCRPVVAFEFGQFSYQEYGVDPGEVFDFFASRDFGIRDILGVPMASRQQFIDSSSDQKVWDYAAIPAELAAAAPRFFRS